MSLRGVPSENKTLLLVKAAIADPKLIDEFLVLMSKNTGIPQYEISLEDIKQAMTILASSDFWSSVRSMGIGAKYNKTQRQPKPRRVRPTSPESSSSSSDDSDSSSSSSSAAGGLDLGFSEDEAQPSPPKQVVKKKIAKNKKPDSDVEMASPNSDGGSSSSSSSSDSSSSDSGSSDSSSDSSSSDSSSSDTSVEAPEAAQVKVKSGKDKRKKKQSGFVARRRAEQADQAQPREVPNIPKFAPKLSAASAPSSEQTSSSSSDSSSSSGSSSSPASSPEPPKAPEPSQPPSRKMRRPADWQNENSPPSNSSKPPSPKKIRTETLIPTPTSPAPDWASDYGRLVRQAIDNRRVCPFRTLGLAPSSTMAEVKKRWAKLCLLLHPDKAPAEWKSVPELVDANQAINDAKKTIEQRMQATALSRPQKPTMHPNPFTVDRGNFGKRRIEIRWNPSQISSSRERVEKYIVFLLQQSPRAMVNAGSVREGTDPFFVLVEDDQRFAKFFQNQSVTVSVLANNGAGNSDPLTIVIPLK